MEINFNEYKILKLSHYLKEKNLFFLFSGTTKKYINWLTVEQKVKKTFKFYKIFNKAAYNSVLHSIFKNNLNIIKGLIYILETKITEKIEKKNIEQDNFLFMAIKLNQMLYDNAQLTFVYSFYYLNLILFLFQHKIIKQKIISK